MVQSEIETIVAEATPRGRAGVGVVRVSGPKATMIAKHILGKVPKTRHVEYLPFLDKNGECLDQGIALFFKGPHSFTGEDVLELQGHGGPVVMNCLVQEAVNAGARIAEPGEFSLRAFLNNKIDLLQAEAIADLINATTKQAATSALRSMQGEFSNKVNEIVEDLIHLRMYVEAAIDFPEEEIDFLSDGPVQESLNALTIKLDNVLVKAEQGSLISEGVRVVIIGRPNAGKSSLLNVLSGYDAAIVTDIPGTTRDVLREQISIDGLLVQLIDTAGLRIGSDVVEQEGIRRALNEITLADHVVLVVDSTETKETEPHILFPEWMDKFPKDIGITVLCNKIDKLGIPSGIEEKKGYSILSVSVKTQDGIALFREHLKKTMGYSDLPEGNFIARSRHVSALASAKEHLLKGKEQLVEFRAGELLAEELRLAQLVLEQITGRFSSDDLLGKIFSEFCIGK